MKAKVNDQHLQGINTFFLRGLALLITLLDNFIDLKVTANMDCLKDSIQLNGKIVKLDSLQLDIVQARKDLTVAIRMLSLGNVICLQKRKSNLHQYLDRRYHHLTQPSNPVTSELLGYDLETKNC